METDASLLGWGARCGDLQSGGLWTNKERSMHINCLELLGGVFAVKKFAKQSQNLHIRLQMDSTTAVAYVNRMGGTHSSTLSNMACSLWQWCLQRGITLSAEHLPGIHNQTADAESRTFHSSAEWQLLPSIFRRINTLLGPCQVDLFATRLNHQLPCYISWRPDLFGMSKDAFQGKWTGFLGYAFPPFALVGKCLQKVRREKGSLLIVATVWPSQAWYPLLLEYSVQSPVLIPMYSNILHDPFGHRHPMVTQGQLQLAAWKVSGRATEQQEFRKGLPSLYCQGGAKEHHHPISQAGRSGVAGVVEGKLILFHVI